MKITYTVILILTILLSIATGVFKVLQQKADIDLFNTIGIGIIGTTILGIVQVTGGVLLIFPACRKSGALIMVATFCIATTAVFANRLYVFGLVSILFILMALFLLLTNVKNEKKS